MNEEEIKEITLFRNTLETMKHWREETGLPEGIEYDKKEGKSWSEPYNRGYIDGLKLALGLLKPIIGLITCKQKKRSGSDKQR